MGTRRGSPRSRSSSSRSGAESGVAVGTLRTLQGDALGPPGRSIASGLDDVGECGVGRSATGVSGAGRKGSPGRIREADAGKPARPLRDIGGDGVWTPDPPGRRRTEDAGAPCRKVVDPRGTAPGKRMPRAGMLATWSLRSCGAPTEPLRITVHPSCGCAGSLGWDDPGKPTGPRMQAWSTVGAPAPRRRP